MSSYDDAVAFSLISTLDAEIRSKRNAGIFFGKR